MRPQTEPPRPQSCHAIQWKWKLLHNILQPEAGEKNDESLKNWNTLSDVVPQTIVRWFVHPSGLQTTPNDYTFATHEIEQEKCIFFSTHGLLWWKKCWKQECFQTPQLSKESRRQHSPVFNRDYQIWHEIASPPNKAFFVY